MAFTGKRPTLCKYALANHLWLGRIDPLLWRANLTHEMCLALARTVATKVVLRAGNAQTTASHIPNHWDHVFQQSGLVGSAVVFHNGDATHAVQSLPPRKLNDALAVTFCTDLPTGGSQEEGRAAVRRIAQLQLEKSVFEKQADSLRATNMVYKEGLTEINRELLTEWLNNEDSAVPPPVLDCVVTVPVGNEGPGDMRQQGPAGATEQRTTPEDEPVVFAMESTVTDFNESRTDACSRIVLLLHKLEELEAAGARSVAVEMESVVDGQETLIDHVGRKRILELCQEIHESCRKVSAQEMRVKLEEELRDAVMGKSRWYLQGQAADAARTDSQRDMGQHSRLGGDQPSTEQFSLRRSESAATEVRSEDLPIPHQPSTEQSSLRRSETAATEVRSEDLEVPHLAVARGKKPLSLWDWKIWTMAKPKLWRYGDASNLYERETALSTTEWAACLLLREAGRMG